MENIIKVPTSSYILENIKRIAFELQNRIQGGGLEMRAGYSIALWTFNAV